MARLRSRLVFEGKNLAGKWNWLRSSFCGHWTETLNMHETALGA